MIEIGQAETFTHRETFVCAVAPVRHPWGEVRGYRGLRGRHICRHCQETFTTGALSRHLKGICGEKARMLASLRRAGIRTETYEVDHYPELLIDHDDCPRCKRRMVCMSLPKATQACHHCGVEYRNSDLQDALS